MTPSPTFDSVLVERPRSAQTDSQDSIQDFTEHRLTAGFCEDLNPL